MEVRDAYGRSEKDLYNELEKDYTIPKELGKTKDEADENQAELYFWEDDANELLASIGLDQNFSLENVDKEQRDRLFRYYHSKSQKTLDNGKVVDVDPIPSYRAESNDYEVEMKKLGYELGKQLNLGIFYRLLPDDNFRNGYYLGKFETAIELDNDNLILEVAKELQVYDALKKEEYLEYLCNNCFKENDLTNNKKL